MNIVITSISFCEYLIQQANGLAGPGHRVLLVMPDRLVGETVGPDSGRLLAPGVELHAYDLNGRRTAGFYTGLFRRIAAFAPDLLHIHENGEMETLALMLRFRRLPLVVTVHDVTPHPGADSRHKLRRRLIRKGLLHSADVIHLHGAGLRQALASISPRLARRSVVIPHGALSLFREWETGKVEREPLTCLFFGRMEQYRGLDNLVEIGRRLKERLPGIRVIVAGRGSELGRYRTALEEVGIFEIHDRFIPNGEVFRLFRRASLVLLPYHEASQSGVVNMGLPFGVPMVATAVGAIPETIDAGIHGRLVPPGDLEGFTTAVIDLLTDERLRGRMADSCLHLAHELSFASLAGRFVSLYDQAARTRHCSGRGIQCLPQG